MPEPTDVTYIKAEDLLDTDLPTETHPGSAIGNRRRALALSLAFIGFPLLTVLLRDARETFSIESTFLLFMLAVVGVAAIGGIGVGLLSALFAAYLIDFFFVAPLHTLDTARTDQAVAIFVFVIVAGIVSTAVEIATRRTRAASQAISQSQILADLAGAKLDESEALLRILQRARQTFHMQTVTLKVRDHSTNEWLDLQTVGWSESKDDQPLRFDIPVGDIRLVGRGPALFAEDQQVLRSFALAARNALEGDVLAKKARETAELSAETQRRKKLFASVATELSHYSESLETEFGEVSRVTAGEHEARHTVKALKRITENLRFIVDIDNHSIHPSIKPTQLIPILERAIQEQSSPDAISIEGKPSELQALVDPDIAFSVFLNILAEITQDRRSKTSIAMQVSANTIRLELTSTEAIQRRNGEFVLERSVTGQLLAMINGAISWDNRNGHPVILVRLPRASAQ